MFVLRETNTRMIICSTFPESEVLYMGKNQHVTPHRNGGWQVKGAGNSRATVRTSTQKEAMDIARTIAINQHSERIVHGTDGRIRSKDSYGNDPFPPRG